MNSPNYCGPLNYCSPRSHGLASSAWFQSACLKLVGSPHLYVRLCHAKDSKSPPVLSSICHQPEFQEQNYCQEMTHCKQLPLRCPGGRYRSCERYTTFEKLHVLAIDSLLSPPGQVPENLAVFNSLVRFPALGKAPI